jgi:UDP-glucose 4-epimerase
MRILLTGATGFVGRALLPALLAEHEVVALARRPGQLPAHPRLAAVGCDWAAGEPAALPATVDAIVHLAAVTAGFPDKEREMFAVNTGSTQWLLEYGRRAGARQFVFASTGDVYGGLGPSDEADPPAPRSFYGTTKYAAELLVRAYDRYLAPCVLRLYHPHGPGQTGRLVPNLAARLRAGEPIRIHASGRPHFTPTYIDDVVAAFREVIARGTAGVFNVAGDTRIDIRSLVGVLAEVVGCRPVFDESGPDTGDLAARNARLKQLLGDWPRVGLAEGLRRTCAAAPAPARRDVA